jgi:hypothetical protein
MVRGVEASSAKIVPPPALVYDVSPDSFVNT